MLSAHVLLLFGLIRALDVRALGPRTAAVLASLIPMQPRQIAPPPVLPEVQLESAVPAASLLPPLPTLELPAPLVQVPAGPTASSPYSLAPPHTPVVFVSGPVGEDAYYPKAARQRGEAGNVLMRVCVDARGRLSTVGVIQGTGFRDLDDAALDVARNSIWGPATTAGLPAYDCASFQVNFVLHRPLSVGPRSARSP